MVNIIVIIAGPSEHSLDSFKAFESMSIS